MADKNETSTPAKTTSQKPGPAVSEEAVINTDLFDQALMEADPEFVKGLSDIGPDINAANVIDDAALEPSDLDGENAEMDLGDLTLMGRVRRLWQKTKLKFKRRWKVFTTQALLFVTETIPELGKQGLQGAKHLAGNIQSLLKALLKLNGKQKLSILVMMIFFALGVGVILKSMKNGILPEYNQIVIPRLDDFANKIFFVEQKDAYDVFYDSARASQNLVSLKRMVFNIQASRSSGRQPMAAVELFIEGYSPDVIIEIKDREPELLDLLQREGEQLTYDQLSTAEGKRNFSEKLQNTVNQVLTEGKVKKIYLKNFILKP
jgi:flagellar basal body-associated protein FliL